MKKYYTLVISILIFCGLNAQSNFKINFTPKIANQTFLLNEVVSNTSNLKMNIEHFKYYISNLHIFYDGNQDLDLSDSIYLVSHDAFNLDLGILNITNVEKIKFGVGVPFELSHTDISTYPEGHPLTYQTPSMQWGWSAGYIHMIVGGNVDSDQNNVPDKYFEIHSLGDGNYRQVEVLANAIETQNGVKEIFINCNLDNWLGTTNLITTGIKHGENGVNFNVMKNIITNPVFTSNLSTDISENFKNNGESYSYKKEAKNFLVWNSIPNLNNFKIYDINGKIVLENSINTIAGETEISIQRSGVYFVEFYSKNESLLNKIKITL